ncbi:YfcE family phosphodiesterase [Furfurilactobacillus sp. WILCCON 0119]|uniref:YfcE family phosphodiesterase n=1 Tax=Furfurilactobacillus entadae TaxID=2922307 RepID=UPI0035ED98FD
MRLLVVSDSHGDREILVRLQQQFAGTIDGWFHCGDSELAADDVLWQTMHVVGGNMDVDPAFLDQELVTIGDQRVFLTHGHLYHIKRDLTALALAARQEQATLVCFGHSHELGVVENAGTLFLNPGSISQPRGQYADLGGTFALVDVLPTHTEVRFCTRDGQVVPALTVTFPREDTK